MTNLSTQVSMQIKELKQNRKEIQIQNQKLT